MVLQNLIIFTWAKESLLPGDTSPLIISDDDDDDNLVSISKLFARADPDPAPTAATATPAAGTHKRQTSEAVRREERPNGPETTPATPQQQAQGTDTGAGTGAGAANDIRKSGRARKPKRYN